MWHAAFRWFVLIGLVSCVRPAAQLRHAAPAELDRDGDAIADQLDRCPDGPRVHDSVEDEDGCPDLERVAPGRVITICRPPIFLDAIYFQPGSGLVRPAALPALEAAAQTLNNYQIQEVELEGHAAVNEKRAWALSAARARAVVQWLRDAGVQTQLRAVPYGSTRPLCTERAEMCWSKNRRVTYKILRPQDQWSEPASGPR